MLISIDNSSHVPIFKQIVDQVIFNIAAGGLDAGALIPSVRDLGGQLMVHPNTVAKAYQKLEELGVVEARRGCGMEVTADARKICQAERRERVGERIRTVLREAVSSGLSAEEIRRLVEDEIGRISGKRRE